MNEVKVIKLCTGEEVVAKVSESLDHIILKKPLMISQVPGAQQGQIGIGLLPWIMTAEADEVTIDRVNIIAILSAKSEVEKMFLEQSSGLTLLS
jgi:hypothetical protein